MFAILLAGLWSLFIDQNASVFLLVLAARLAVWLLGPLFDAAVAEKR